MGPDDSASNHLLLQPHLGHSNQATNSPAASTASAGGDPAASSAGNEGAHAPAPSGPPLNFKGIKHKWLQQHAQQEQLAKQHHDEELQQQQLRQQQAAAAAEEVRHDATMAPPVASTAVRQPKHAPSPTLCPPRC